MKEHLKEYKKQLEGVLCEYMEQPPNERYATAVERLISCWKAIDDMERKISKDERLSISDLFLWDAAMENEDGTKGGHYSLAQTSAAARTAGVQFSEVSDKEWNIAMNMMYSDYKPVLDKFNIKAPDFYAELAKCFLFDRDGGGPKQKLAKYYKSIVES